MKLFEMFVELGLDTKNFQSQAAGAASSMDKVGNSAKNTKGPLDTMTKGISATTIAMGQMIAKAAEWTINGAKDLASSGFVYNQKMEDYTTNFKVMLGGNIDAAKAKVQELSDFAASTPFGMDSLAGATQTLLAFGVSAEQSTGYLKQLGDISLGDANKLQRLTTAFGKAAATGKVTGEVVQSMTAAGFNPLRILSEKTGESMESLEKRMGEGKLSFKELQMAMTYATSAGGQFYKGMEEASKTVSGMTSTLTDNFTSLLGTLTTPFYNVYKDTILPRLLETVGGLTDWAKSEDTQKSLKAFEDWLNGIANMKVDWNGLKKGLNITLENFGLPKIEDMQKKLSAWWSGDGEANGGVMGAVGDLFKTAITIDTNGDGGVSPQELDDWFDGVMQKVGGVFTAFFGIDPNGKFDPIAAAKWFAENALPKIGEFAVGAWNLIAPDWAETENIKKNIETWAGDLSNWWNGSDENEGARAHLNFMLHELGMPDLDESKKAVSGWWNGTDGSIGVKGSLEKLMKAGITIDTDGDGNVTKDELETWFANVLKNTGAVFAATLGIKTTAEGVSYEDVDAWVDNLWKSVGDHLLLAFTPKIDTTKELTTEEITAADNWWTTKAWPKLKGVLKATWNLLAPDPLETDNLAKLAKDWWEGGDGKQGFKQGLEDSFKFVFRVNFDDWWSGVTSWWEKIQEQAWYKWLTGQYNRTNDPNVQYSDFAYDEHGNALWRDAKGRIFVRDDASGYYFGNDNSQFQIGAEYRVDDFRRVMANEYDKSTGKLIDIPAQPVVTNEAEATLTEQLAALDEQIITDPNLAPDARMKLQQQLNNLGPVTAQVNLYSGSSSDNIMFGAGFDVAKLASEATGLDYVSEDGPVYVHQREAILDPQDAEAWRNGQTGGSMSKADMQSAFEAAIKKLMGSLHVEMDGETVGRIVTPAVSTQMGRMMSAREAY